VGRARGTAPVPREGRAATPDLAGILAPVAADLVLVEQELRKSLGSDIEIIRVIGQYLSEGGGKRIRPALHLLCARMSGYRGDRHIQFASVFELIHTATLVHDDVIDGSTLRRGRSTVHARWGNHLTVLLGDHLYLTAMNAALRADDLRLIKILCDITLEMIQGEILQSHLNGRIDVGEAEHLEVMRRKTALLFSGCAQVAGILAEAPRERVADLEAFGLDLGMAYQIVDDLLDFTADPAVLGKPVASDLREGRLTLPLVYLLENGRGEHREMVRAVLEDRDFVRVSLGEVIAELERWGALARARSLADRYSAAALARLSAFPDSAARRSLEEACGFVTARSY
jgi:octaprenyl-diphosphate synthase